LVAQDKVVSSKGSLTGNVWTYFWDGAARGDPAKSRCTEVQGSPTSYTLRVEDSVAGGLWTVIDEGKATGVK
jgi:hypothetical protein